MLAFLNTEIMQIIFKPTLIHLRMLKGDKLMREFIKTKYALPAIIGCGLILTIAIIKLQPAMEHDPQTRPPVAVSVIEAQQHNLRPAIIGFGTVMPDLNLEAKSEVRGRITFIHPELKKGAMLSKDTVLLRIDDKDYRLALTQAKADMLANQASVKEMELTIENNKLDLKLANEKLKLRQRELNRLAKLRKTGAVSQSVYEAEHQNLLQQQQEVQKLESLQITLPSDLEVVNAKVAIASAKVEQSQRDLERTELTIPFSGRISNVYTEMDQYVAIGTQLFDVTGLEKVVINAQFPLDQFEQFATNFDSSKIRFDDINTLPSMGELLYSLGLTATVELVGGNHGNWQAKVERFSNDINPKSRTVGVTVSVSGSYQNIKPGVRPPLLEGMYTRVRLKGAATNYIALPRYALHKKQVFTVSEQSTLQRNDLADIQLQGSLVLIKNGITPGAKVITSDVFPAIEGMSLIVSKDEIIEKQMSSWVEAAK